MEREKNREINIPTEKDIVNKAKALVDAFGEPVDEKGKKVSVSLDGTIGSSDCATLSILSGFRENEVKINYELKERSGKVRLNSFIFKDNGLSWRSIKERNPGDYMHSYSQIEAGNKIEFYELLGLESLLSKAETKLNENADSKSCLESVERPRHAHTIAVRHKRVHNRSIF